jgi:hypothetical protein
MGLHRILPVCDSRNVPGIAHVCLGKGLANPTALLLSSLMMLRHMNLNAYADKIEKATLTVREHFFLSADVLTTGLERLSLKVRRPLVIWEAKHLLRNTRLRLLEGCDFDRGVLLVLELNRASWS